MIKKQTNWQPKYSATDKLTQSISKLALAIFYNLMVMVSTSLVDFTWYIKDDIVMR
jgi:hypothetical protein